MKLTKRGRIARGILIFITFMWLISIMPNAEPTRMDGEYYKWNGDYYEEK